MFSVYNETGAAPQIIALNTDKIIIIKKQVKVNENYNKSLDIKMSKKIIFSSPIEVTRLQARLSKTIKTPEPVKVIDKELSTIFSRTDFSPSILCTKSNKALALISLDLTNRHIIGINNSNCFIFDHVCTNNELCMFVSVNRYDSPLIVTLYDKELDKVIKYVFTNINEGELSLTKTESNVSERKLLDIKLKKKYTINNFRPARSTYNIVSLPNKEAPKVINFKSYNVIPFCTINDSLDKLFNNLVVNKVSAVTIYTKDMTEVQIEKAVEKAKNYMTIVYTMDENGKITRCKVAHKNDK